MGNYIKPSLSFSSFWREFTKPKQFAHEEVSPFEPMRILQPHLQCDLLA
jgi:hypothetical protein